MVRGKLMPEHGCCYSRLVVVSKGGFHRAVSSFDVLSLPFGLVTPPLSVRFCAYLVVRPASKILLLFRLLTVTLHRES